MPSDLPPNLAGALTWLGCHSISIAVAWERKAINEGQDGVGLPEGQGRQKAEVKGLSLACLWRFHSHSQAWWGQRSDHIYTPFPASEPSAPPLPCTHRAGSPSPACSLACTLGGEQAMRTGLTLGVENQGRQEAGQKEPPLASGLR